MEQEDSSDIKKSFIGRIWKRDVDAINPRNEEALISSTRMEKKVDDTLEYILLLNLTRSKINYFFSEIYFFPHCHSYEADDKLPIHNVGVSPPPFILSFFLCFSNIFLFSYHVFFHFFSLYKNRIVCDLFQPWQGVTFMHLRISLTLIQLTNNNNNNNNNNNQHRPAPKTEAIRAIIFRDFTI